VQRLIDEGDVVRERQVTNRRGIHEPTWKWSNVESYPVF
jgi:hypothetical protein